ncbi:MAG: copper resistance protein CopZ [Nitrospirales bacterium]|nr:copper resistance protein CopZ [Nitrospirales bacterium]
MVKTEQFSVIGMTCGNCVRHVEKALRGVPGVSSVTVVLDAAQATVEYDADRVTVDALTSVMTEAGYTLGATPV